MERQLIGRIVLYEVEREREFTFIGDTESAGGECEAALTARARCGWVLFWGCDVLLYGRRFPQSEWAVCRSYVLPAILY